MRTFDERPSGLSAAPEMPWGSHFCVLYTSKRDLLEVLVPFVRAGLESGELCSWEVREPLTPEEATRALAQAVPDLAAYLDRGQLEIAHTLSESSPAEAGEALERLLDRAVLAGFDGARLVRHASGGDGARPVPGAEAIRKLNVVAAFLYRRSELRASDLMRVVQGHRFALVQSSGRWEVLEGSEARIARDALERSEEKLQSLFRNMSEGFAYHRIVLDARGEPCDYVFLEVNPAFERLTGLSAEDVLGKRATQVHPGIEEDPAGWIGKYGRVALTGEPAHFESYFSALDRWYAVSVFSGHRGYFAVTFSDVSDRKRAEAEQRAAEERLSVTLRSIGDAVIATDTAGRVTLMNRVAESLTGWTQAEAAGRPLGDVFRIVDERTGAVAEDPVRKVFARGTVVGLANHTVLVARDGRRIAIADSAAPVRGGGGLLGVVLVFRDVTAERRAEQEREITIEFLRLVNENARSADLVRAAADFFQRRSGSEAVGIRLAQGEDFPYCEAIGFTEEFVRLENRLCAQDATGGVCRDAAGAPVLECLCGDVIRGRGDPTRPFFTAAGSFWTSSTTELLGSAAELARARNRCNQEGYESVALVPLRAREGRVGLLQLCDRRRGMLTAESVALWERLADHLAVALARSRAEEELALASRRLQALAEAAQRENRELAIGNRILEVFVDESGDALYDRALDIVLGAMESRHGVLGYIDETGDLVCPTMSRLLAGCPVEGKCLIYPRDQWKGLWRRALLERRSLYSNEPAAVPAGHVPILRNLATPILFQGKVIGLLHLANKGSDYGEADRELLESIARQIAPVLYARMQKDLRERDRTAAERALRESEVRYKLLSDTAGLLLAAEAPEPVVNRLCRDVMAHLDCQAFFNFLVDVPTGRLRLNTCAGISEDEARRIEWLDVGVAVSGCVARDGQRIVAEDIQRSDDPRADLVRSYGIHAYCCHPLMAQGRVIGTLSFGTKTRPRFSGEDIALMKTVADQVAVAMQRVQAQAVLRAANALLLEGDRRKNEFLAMLSHELRNPLAPISNSLYVLERAAPGGPQARRAKEVIDRQVGHLARMVDDLLDVTRISRNKITLHRERADLREIVQRSAEDQRSIFERGEIDLAIDVPPQPLFVNVDATRVAQVVGNLLQNAAKFTARGGRASVRVTGERARGRAIVRVADTGVGMSTETLAGLFQPFMQADRTLDRSRGGLGLGLALVKGLVELHGGEVRGHSDGLGKGAEFVVELPLDDGARADLGPPEAARPRRRRRVLIIEDNVDAAHSLRDALELGDHEVAVAYDGPGGLTCARAFHPDVVFCDIGLPGMDGFAVARAFRADEALRGAHLVALSGYALPEDLQRAAEAGFARHLAKPPSIEGLERVLEEGPALTLG